MRNGLLVFSTFAMLMSSAFAGDVVLHLKSDDDGSNRAVYKLGAVAKIKQDLKLTLSNGGFSTQAIDAVSTGAFASETFGFGSVVAFSSAVGGEQLAINPLAADISVEVCSNADDHAFHIKKIIDGSQAADGSPELSPLKAFCSVTGAVGSRKVSAGFTSRYKLDAAGGMLGVLELYAENGVEATLDSTTTFDEMKMLTATIANSSDPFPDLSPAAALADDSILLGGSGARLIDQAQGQLSYTVSFDIDGAAAGPEKRVAFSHELMLDI